MIDSGARLLELAADRSDAGRRTLAHAVSDFFLHEEDQLSGQAETLLYDILRQVIHELEMPLRQAVSLRLADHRDVPVDLILDLANDQIEVAYPILIRSPLLTPEHLLMVIRGESIRHRMAVAGRRDLTEGLTDALIARGEEQVILKVLENLHAPVSQASMKLLVRQSRDNARLQRPLVRRKDLPPALALEMFTWVSAALRQYILDRNDIDPAVLDRVLEEAVMDDVQSTGQSRDLPGGDADASPATDGETQSERIARTLNDTSMSRFLSHLQSTTGLDYGLMLRALFEPSGKGLVVICRAHGIGKSLFASIFGYMQKARYEKSGDNLRTSLTQAINLYSRITDTAAKDVVSAWLTRADFYAALNDLRLK